MNFSKEGATSEKVHQVEPKNKKSLSLDIHSHGSTFKGVTGWPKNDIAYQLHNRC